MQYSNEVIKHFKKPRNQGTIKEADAVGQVGNAACGDVMKIYLKFADQKGGKIVKNIKFETLGCAAAIAVSSAYTDRVKGKTVEKALAITKDDIVKDLGGLPPAKIHCSMLAIEAFKKALETYQSK